MSSWFPAKFEGIYSINNIQASDSTQTMESDCLIWGSTKTSPIKIIRWKQAGIFSYNNVMVRMEDMGRYFSFTLISF